MVISRKARLSTSTVSLFPVPGIVSCARLKCECMTTSDIQLTQQQPHGDGWGWILGTDPSGLVEVTHSNCSSPLQPHPSRMSGPPYRMDPPARVMRVSCSLLPSCIPSIFNRPHSLFSPFPNCHKFPIQVTRSNFESICCPFIYFI